MDAKLTDDLTFRLRNTMLYAGHGEGSALPDEAADCIDAQAAEITALRAERDAFRAVLEGAEYRDLETVATYTPAQARQLGEFAKASTLGVLAERDALAARLAVPGEDGFTYQVRRAEWRVVKYTVDQYGQTDQSVVETTLATWPTVELARADMPAHGYEHKHVAGRWIPHDKAHDYEVIAVAYREVVVPNLLTALRARAAGLEGALERLQAGDCPRPLGERWRADGVPSTYDRCIHGAMMNEPCETCADAFISAALSPSAAQEARDALR